MSGMKHVTWLARLTGFVNRVKLRRIDLSAYEPIHTRHVLSRASSIVARICQAF